jgi:hypothetical protein
MIGTMQRGNAIATLNTWPPGCPVDSLFRMPAHAQFRATLAKFDRTCHRYDVPQLSARFSGGIAQSVVFLNFMLLRKRSTTAAERLPGKPVTCPALGRERSP